MSTRLKEPLRALRAQKAEVNAHSEAVVYSNRRHLYVQKTPFVPRRLYSTSKFMELGKELFVAGFVTPTRPF